MKNLNEDVAINDPQLAQQYANGQKQLMDKDKQINALQQQINNIEKQKNEISKQMAMIQQKAAQAQPVQNQNNNQNNQNNNIQNNNQNTSESLVIKESINSSESYYQHLVNTYERLTDELMKIMNNDPNNKNDINKLKYEIQDVINELNEIDEEEDLYNRQQEQEINRQQQEQEMYWREQEQYENVNPMSVESFYTLNEAYVENEDEDIKKKLDDTDKDPFVIYLKIEHEGDMFIGKVFKTSEDSDWYGLVTVNEDKKFEKISYPSSYEEDDIISFLEDTYDLVEPIDVLEYNEYIKDEESLEDEY